MDVHFLKNLFAVSVYINFVLRFLHQINHIFNIGRNLVTFDDLKREFPFKRIIKKTPSLVKGLQLRRGETFLELVI